MTQVAEPGLASPDAPPIRLKPPAGTFTWSEKEPSVIAWQPSTSWPPSRVSRPATAPSPKLNMKRERSLP